MSTIKVLRSLREQNVDGKVRHYGDFLPEAESWPNLATYLRNGYVEETYVDSDQYEELLAKQRAGDDVVLTPEEEAILDEALEEKNPDPAESVGIVETEIVGDEQPADEIVLAEAEAGEDVGEERRTLPAGEPVIHDSDPKKRVKIRKAGKQNGN